MKKMYKASVFACVVLLAACQPKSEPKDDSQNSPVDSSIQTPTEPTLKGESVKVQVTLPTCEGNTCPDFTVDRLQSNFPFIDQLIEHEILKQLAKMLDIADVEAAASTVTTAADRKNLDLQTQLYANAFIKIDQELKQLSSSHEISLMISPKILQTKANLSTVVLNSSSYLGGAHGSTAQRYYNFDLKQQKQIQLADVLQPQQQANLEKLAHKAFTAWIIDSKVSDNAKEYEQAWPFRMSDNFLFSEQGLILQYAEYEIGPYVVGLPRLLIPFAQLQGVLKPEYLPQPKPVAAASTVVANKPA